MILSHVSRFAVGISVLCTFMAALFAMPAPAWGSRAVVIYVDADFQGGSQTLTPGRYDVEQLTIGNDQLSSLRVPEGWRVTLFSDARFSGMEKTFTSDTPWVGDDFNDYTSAVLVEGPD